MAACIVIYTILMFLPIFATISVVIESNKALGIMNVVSDVYILCVPTAAISKLQLSKKRKIGVMLVFVTGVMYVLSLCNVLINSADFVVALV